MTIGQTIFGIMTLFGRLLPTCDCLDKLAAQERVFADKVWDCSENVSCPTSISTSVQHIQVVCKLQLTLMTVMIFINIINISVSWYSAHGKLKPKWDIHVTGFLTVCNFTMHVIY